MSDENQTAGKKDEVLAMKYDSIRSELIDEKKLAHQHVSRGVAATSIIGAYAFLSQEPIFLSLIPIIISFVAILAIIQANEVLILAWEAYEIEENINMQEFNYEHKLGFTGNQNKRDNLSNWYGVPAIFLIIITAVAYTSFGVISYLSISPQTSILGVNGKYILFITFTLLTIFMLMSIFSTVKLSNTIAESIDDIESTGYIFTWLYK